MTKVTNIPGRLHSVEQGNIVAGANEVYDDTKGKKQNVINSDTDAELLRLEQSKQDNLTFDNAPTENSNNPVKSGGVYAADLVLQQAIEAILLLIPSAATSLNQLADKAFVNSSISTATATFRGTYNVVTDLHLAVDATHAQIETALASVIATADNNDYCFVQTPVNSSSQDIQRTSRYKFNGSAWGFEYDLNTSGFTSAQWAAINSGITAALVTKLGDLPYASELSEDLQGLSTAIQGILNLIPSAATSSNKLTDKAYVDGLIQAITALIPAEATDQNQLADKAYVLAQILAATPAFKGQFTTLVDLEDVSSPKAGDIGIVRTTDSDGFDTFTFYQYLNSQWNVYYTLAHHLQSKPATTGTSGDYPYNGMGRVVLPMNIKEIGGVTANYLEQSMMPTATGGNTIYVITHDYVLASNITIPANCVLDFEGGSISGGTVDFNNCQIIGTNSGLTSTIVPVNLTEIKVEWFGILPTNADNANKINTLITNLASNSVTTLVFHQETYNIGSTITFNSKVNVMGYPTFHLTDNTTTAVVISNAYEKLYQFSVLGIGPTVWRNTNNYGVKIYNSEKCIIDIPKLVYVTKGLLLVADGNNNDGGCAWNHIYARYIYSAIHGFIIESVNAGWPNANVFHGGYIGMNSGTFDVTGVTEAISDIVFKTDGRYYGNALYFYDFFIEHHTTAGKISGLDVIPIDMCTYVANNDRHRGYKNIVFENPRVELEQVHLFKISSYKEVVGVETIDFRGINATVINGDGISIPSNGILRNSKWETIESVFLKGPDQLISTTNVSRGGKCVAIGSYGQLIPTYGAFGYANKAVVFENFENVPININCLTGGNIHFLDKNLSWIDPSEIDYMLLDNYITYARLNPGSAYSKYLGGTGGCYIMVTNARNAKYIVFSSGLSDFDIRVPDQFIRVIRKAYPLGLYGDDTYPGNVAFSSLRAAFNGGDKYYDLTDNTLYMIKKSGSVGNIGTVTATAESGSRQIILSNVANLFVGDYITINAVDYIIRSIDTDTNTIGINRSTPSVLSDEAVTLTAPQYATL